MNEVSSVFMTGMVLAIDTYFEWNLFDISKYILEFNCFSYFLQNADRALKTFQTSKTLILIHKYCGIFEKMFLKWFSSTSQ